MLPFKSLLTIAVIIALSFGLCSCATTDGSSSISHEDNTNITEWVDLMYSVASRERLNPPRAARAYAYVMTALYEGYVHGLEESESMAGKFSELDALPEPNPEHQYDWHIVANTAAHEMARHLFFETASISTINAFENHQSEVFESRDTNDAVRKNSTRYGEEIGQALIAWADSDGINDLGLLAYEAEKGPSSYVPTTEYGTTMMLNPATNITHLYDFEDPEARSEAEAVLQDWQSNKLLHDNHPRTVVERGTVMEPNWGSMRPIVLDDVNDFLPVEPKNYSEDKESLFYEEATAVYDVSQNLTEEQEQTLHFWIDNPGETGTPAGHWFKLSSQLAQEQDLSLSETLETVLLTTITMHDVHVACWKAKYQYNLVRPQTVINRWLDEHWTSAIPIPPHPEYPSGHASTSGAATIPLTTIFGEMSFTDETHKNRYGFSERTYNSFAEAAQEAARSRLYGGLHYPMGNQNGLHQGEKVGRAVTSTILSQTRGDDFNLDKHVPEQFFEPIYPDTRLTDFRETRTFTADADR